jgi:hypothetical protein
MSLNKLYERLGLNENNGLHKRGKELPNYPSRVKNSLKKIDYDAIYSVENKPLIIFKELRKSSGLKKKIESLHRDIWNLNETPILFIKLNNEYWLFNSFIFDKKNNEIWKKITRDDDLEEFSYLNIASGKLWTEYENDFDGKKRVQEYLLNNLRTAREILKGKGLEYTVINSLIGRLLFSRYLIDRNILKKENFKKIYEEKNFEDIIENKKELYKYFKYLKKRFNGDLFPITAAEEKSVDSRHLKILSDMFKGHDLSSGQAVLFDIYDFSIIPIELISIIYETFLDKKEKKSQGVFYTPLYLVDYILNSTLDDKLEKIDECKILDPSCGSGVFLVESLRKLIEKKMESNVLTSEDLELIVKNNIFGIDADEDAINISIFSIYLTLLDYSKNKNFKFPKLKNKNLFVSDFFDLNANFNEKLNRVGKVDLILGNPPWKSEKDSGNELYHDYCKQEKIPMGNNQISESFLVRIKDFVKKDANIALIVTSKILYNSRDEKFREYFLKNFYINKVLELSTIRTKLFSKASWPGTVLFYKFAENQDTDDNLIEHISVKPNRFFNLFGKIVIEKYDIKNIKQCELLKFDWLWKVLLVGNTLDFYFIKRLHEDYEPIGDFINRSETLIHGVGVNPSGPGKAHDVTNLVDLPYLDLSKKRLKRYHIDYTSKWRKDKVKRIKKELLEPPNILINFSTDPNHRSVAAFSERKIIFLHTVLAIKGSFNDKILLKNILSAINSQLFTYYIFLTGSVGIDIHRTSAKEKLRFPFSQQLIEDENLFEKVDKLEHEINNAEKHGYGDSLKRLSSLESRIDEIIFDFYNLNDLEMDLIDYAVNISIPLLKEKQDPLKIPEKQELIDYAQIFLNHFENSFDPQHFLVEIYDTEYFVGMNFKIVPDKPLNPIQFKKERDISKIINNLGIISLEEIGEIYVQRDLKEFTRTSFSIIKPCERKNWHKAIAWLDLGEFLDIMFKNYVEKRG